MHGPDNKVSNDPFEFFIHTMPPSRPADYQLGCLDGAIFMDFDNYDHKRVCLSAISFDGYGCCGLKNLSIPMAEADSQAFKDIFKSKLSDQHRLTEIVKKTLFNNRKHIWESALNEYGLL